MNPPPGPHRSATSLLVADLRAHADVCSELLTVVSSENRALHGSGPYAAFDFYQRRKDLLPRLGQSLISLRAQRMAWQQLGPAERTQPAEIAALLRSNQDLVMRIIVLDRENEQALLRRGLVPPRHLPPAERARPHFVADLYRRHAAH
jgi:hypothetical protein